jgi:hypothetical protein
MQVQRPNLSAAEVPLTADVESIVALRAVFDDVGYTAAAVREALSTDAAIGRDSADLPVYLRLLADDSRLSTLIKLFLLGVPTSTAEASRALAPMPLERLRALGIVATEQGTVSARIEVVPTEQLLIACDPFRDELTRPDHVPGLSPPAKVLAALTVRAPVESTLDLCTGSGVQALLATAHSQRVTAVDVNPRALQFAAFNAELNSRPRIDLQRGDLFDPVEGSSFDLIVCNPPYVISPESEFVYRDSGARGDTFCERLVRRIPAFLHEGGFAHVLISWLHPHDADWSTPLRGWLDGSGCDALVLRYATHEPLGYAAAWNRPLRSDPAAYAAALERWSRHFEELGVEAISWGAITLRRREARNWVWAYSPSSDRIEPATEHVLRLFAAHDFLAGLSDDDGLLRGCLELVSDHRLDETGRLEAGTRTIERTVLRHEGGLHFEVAVDPATTTVLSLADGQRSVKEILSAAAAAVSAPGDEFVSNALPVVRRLVELGFLVPVQPAPRPAPDSRR